MDWTLLDEDYVPKIVKFRFKLDEGRQCQKCIYQRYYTFNRRKNSKLQFRQQKQQFAVLQFCVRIKQASAGPLVIQPRNSSITVQYYYTVILLHCITALHSPANNRLRRISVRHSTLHYWTMIRPHYLGGPTGRLFALLCTPRLHVQTLQSR